MNDVVLVLILLLWSDDFKLLWNYLSINLINLETLHVSHVMAGSHYFDVY